MTNLIHPDAQKRGMTEDDVKDGDFATIYVENTHVRGPATVVRVQRNKDGEIWRVTVRPEWNQVGFHIPYTRWDTTLMQRHLMKRSQEARESLDPLEVEEEKLSIAEDGRLVPYAEGVNAALSRVALILHNDQRVSIGDSLMALRLLGHAERLDGTFVQGVGLGNWRRAADRRSVRHDGILRSSFLSIGSVKLGVRLHPTEADYKRWEKEARERVGQFFVNTHIVVDDTVIGSAGE